MSIMDLFKPAQQTQSTSTSTQSANQNQNNVGNNSGNNDNLSSSNNSTNSNGKMPGTDQEPVNPLDAYSKMFDNAAKNSDIQAPTFNLDPKVVDEVAGKMNFTQNLNPEIVQKAMQGDARAFMQAIQSASQAAYKAAIQHNTSLTDTFINQRSEYEKKQIDNGVHKQLTSQALSSAPNFSHPVIKQELNRVADQFSRANPDASPIEVAEAAKKYITDLSSALNPTTSTSSNQGKEAEMDWTKYLS